MSYKTIDEKISYPLDWLYYINLEDLKEDIKNLEKLGVTHIEIEPFVSFDVASAEITAFKTRIETYEEYTERIHNENKRKSKVEQDELKLLQKLKNKYENGKI